MLRHAAILLTFAAMQATYADTDLTTLKQQLKQAETQYAELEQRLSQQQQTHRKQLTTLHRQTLTLLHLARWPQPLLIAQSLATTHPNLPGLLSAGARQTQHQLTNTTQQLHAYLALREEARTRLINIHNLQAQLAATSHRQANRQQAALRQALVDATTLSHLLEKKLPPTATPPSPNKPKDSPPPGKKSPALPQLHPVAGNAVSAPDGGLHYLTQPGAQVIATLPGEVIYSGPFRNLGGLIIVQNSGGLHTIYGGLGSLSVATGQTLETGAELGRLPDATPNRPQPQLYYEVRRHGRTLALKPSR